MKLTINENLCGRTVLSVTKSLGISTTLLKRMKRRENGITVNGSHVTVRYVLSLGDELFLDDADTTEDENPHIVPSDIPLEIIYEDDDLFIINKPHSMPTHPSLGHYDDTLANALCNIYKQRNLSFVFRAVNRLDGDTSGAVLIAKSAVSAYILSESMKENKIKKSYIAILDGEIDSPLDEWKQIVTYIRRTKDSIIKREVTDEHGGGDLAVTNYKCVYKGNGYSVVIAEPVTGRTHQLRVHFSYLGHPISGDDFYGGSLSLIKRQALHAHSLSFPKPKDGELLTVKADIPEDMAKLIQMLSENKNKK